MRAINRLTARAVATKGKGYHADGGGLYLKVTEAGTRSWIFRYAKHGKTTDMGLGPLSLLSLHEAREKAVQCRKDLLEGLNPLEARRAVQATSAATTWGECADSYIDSHKSAWKNGAQADQWTQSLTDYGPDRHLSVSAIDTAVVMDCLRSIWTSKTETATRVRGRIERILDWARVSGYRSGENPARWRGHLDKLLPKPSKVKTVKHHAAMPFADVPAFMAELTKRKARSAKALRFTILTGVRTEETVGATWEEFDLESKLWTIPKERMKAGKAHTVPLTESAIELLKAAPTDKPPFALSENAMLYLVQRHMKLPFTVHGFRSSFRDWAAETTAFPGEVVEMALAHAIKDKTEAAYRRGELLAKRRELMEAWEAFLLTASP